MPRARETGSWVLDPIEVFDGEKDLYVYKRPTSKKYQLYLKTLSEGVIRESTKKEKLDEALEYARDRWYEIQSRQRSGLKIIKKEKLLFDFVDEFLEAEKQRIEVIPKKGITKDTYRQKRVHLDWLRQFYGSRSPKLVQIFFGGKGNKTSISEYGLWRRKESKTPPKTNHTINAEISTIRGFFNYLYQQHLIEQTPSLKGVKNEASEELRRDYLTLAEWKRMVPTLNAYRKDKSVTSRQSYNRNVLYYAMVVMINSGLRKGELKQLKWSDLERNPVLKGEDADRHHIICIRGATTKTGKSRRVNSPTQEYFNKLREISHIPKTGRHFPYIPASHKEDFVLCKEGKGDQPLGVGTWNRCWQEIKERVTNAGGDWMETKNITWYSFRHSAISFAVQRGVNHLKLARNVGTGLRYIEGFYYHHESEMSTDELNKGRTFFTKTSALIEPIFD